MEECMTAIVRMHKERQRGKNQMVMPNWKRLGKGPGRREDEAGRDEGGACVVSVSRAGWKNWEMLGSEKGRKDQQSATCLLSAPDGGH